MTAVVGLLNKRGVAIAADSAVTRTHYRDGKKKQKCTNNGSKMLRMSNVVPVSVMLTGNGAFIWNQWDIVIRQYRRDRGNICHATVEACVHDFFEYIAHNDIFWNEQHMKTWIKGNMSWLINTANDYIPWETKITKNDGTFAKPKGYYNAFIKIQEEFGSFDNYIWSFTNGEVIYEPCDLRTTSPLSDTLSKDLKKRGMKFVGSTIIYSYLQAIGIINGHLEGCFKYKTI